MDRECENGKTEHTYNIASFRIKKNEKKAKQNET